jgi:hypothetical protein
VQKCRNTNFNCHPDFQLDNSSSSLDVYELNLGDSGSQMPLVSRHAGSDNRYHKIVWGEAGMQSGDR